MGQLLPGLQSLHDYESQKETEKRRSFKDYYGVKDGSEGTKKISGGQPKGRVTKRKVAKLRPGKYKD
jgi:hypothetical protein